MYHIVHFHAVGRQKCVPGVRCFEDSFKASQFADQQRNLPGHTCKDSVREEISETPVRPYGLTRDKDEEKHPEMLTQPQRLPPRKGFWSRVESVIFGD
jgi:hypothetical protein